MLFRILAITSALAGTIAVANATGDHPHHKPSQAAFDACAKSKQNDACTFRGHSDRELKGTCETPREGQTPPNGGSAALVCRPHHGSKPK